MAEDVGKVASLKSSEYASIFCNAFEIVLTLADLDAWDNLCPIYDALPPQTFA